MIKFLFVSLFFSLSSFATVQLLCDEGSNVHDTSKYINFKINELQNAGYKVSVSSPTIYERSNGNIVICVNLEY